MTHYSSDTFLVSHLTARQRELIEEFAETDSLETHKPNVHKSVIEKVRSVSVRYGVHCSVLCRRSCEITLCVQVKDFILNKLKGVKKECDDREAATNKDKDATAPNKDAPPKSEGSDSKQ